MVCTIYIIILNHIIQIKTSNHKITQGDFILRIKNYLGSSCRLISQMFICHGKVQFLDPETRVQFSSGRRTLSKPTRKDRDMLGRNKYTFLDSSLTIFSSKVSFSHLSLGFETPHTYFHMSSLIRSLLLLYMPVLNLPK